MKRLHAIALGLLIAAVTVAGCAYRIPQQGWVTLIDNGSGIENFDRLGDVNWRTEGGALVGDKGKGGHLVSKKSYKDFEIYAEFWADATTNSGIFIRASDPKKVGAANAYEVNIFDQRPGQEYSTGAIVDFAMVDPKSPPKAGGKWNSFLITAKGPDVTVKFNNQVTAHMRDSKFASGPFTLQFGNRGKEPGGAIKWRKVMIREL